MTKLIPLGAINKHTGEYVYPKIANKTDEYICPECNKELILCKGKIRAHHFRHKVDNVNPCNHYDHPSESQIHKDAKALLKTLLDKKIPISLVRKCASCEKNEEYEIPETSETSIVQIERRFEYNGQKIADIAYLDNGEIVCIFEICNTHRTCDETRPEPWFEIDAKMLIETANDIGPKTTALQIPCIRSAKCEECLQIETNKIHRIYQRRNNIRLGFYKIYTYLNKLPRVGIPPTYIGNITDYQDLFKKLVGEYLTNCETQNPLPITEHYSYYKTVLNNMHNCNSVSHLGVAYWTKHVYNNITDINKFIRSNRLTPPLKLYNQIRDILCSVICDKCNNSGYCICDLTKHQVELLNADICIICEGTKVYYTYGENRCVYCDELSPFQTETRNLDACICICGRSDCRNGCRI